METEEKIKWCYQQINDMKGGGDILLISEIARAKSEELLIQFILETVRNIQKNTTIEGREKIFLRAIVESLDNSTLTH